MAFSHKGLAGYSFATQNTQFDNCGGPPWYPTADVGRTAIAELNGDGRPDLVTRQAARQWNYPHPFYQGSDLVWETRERSYALALSDGSGFAEPANDRYEICSDGTEDCLFSSITDIFSYEHAHCLVFGNGWDNQYTHDLGKAIADVNADGLSDYLVRGEFERKDLSRVHLHSTYLNTGADFAEDSRWAVSTSAFPKAWHTEAYDLRRTRSLSPRFARFTDVNGDGFTDLIYAEGPWIDASFDGEGYRSTHLGTGNPNDPWIEETGWAFPLTMRFTEIGVLQGGALLAPTTGLQLADLNGDGMLDLIKARQGETQEVWLGKGRVPDLLTRVDGPLGGSVSIEYLPSTQFDNSRADGSSGLAQVLQVVSKVTADNGVSVPLVTDYDYEGGLYDPDMRMFMGFRKVRESRNLDSRVVTTEYHQDPPRAGRVKSRAIEALDTSGVDHKLVHKVENFYTDDSSAPYVALLKERVSTEYDEHEVEGVPTGRSARTLYYYDGDTTGDGPFIYGNLTAQVQYGEYQSGVDVVLSDTRVLETDYTVPNVDTYLVGLPSETRLRAGAVVGSGEVHRQTQFYYDGDVTGTTAPTHGNLTRQVEILDKENYEGDSDRVTTFSYYLPSGNLRTITSPRENAGEIGAGTGTTTYGYIYQAFLSSEINGLGHQVSYHYQPDASACQDAELLIPPLSGLVQHTVGPNDTSIPESSITCYGPFGRIAREQSSLNLAGTRWLYGDSNVSVATPYVSEFRRTSDNGDEITSKVFRDGFGRSSGFVIQGPVALGAGIAMTGGTAYDATGRVLSTTAPHYDGAPAWTTDFEYDVLDRTTGVISPGTGRVSETTYDRGRITTVDANGNSTTRVLDPFGRVVEVIEDDGSDTDRTRYEYDVADNLIKITDRGGNETTITYDDLGQRRSIDDPDTGLTVFDHYDADGNLTEESRFGHGAAASTVVSEYDAIGRIVSRTVGTEVATWAYDTATNGVGLLGSRTDESGQFIVDEYDRLGRATKERQILDGREFAFETTYNPESQIRTRTYPTGRVLEWEYDAVGYLTGIRTSGGDHFASNVLWEADGRLRSFLLGNGNRSQFEYESATGRLAGIELWDASQTPEVALDDLSYGYDVGDRLVQIDGTVGTSTFQYDGLNRLTQAVGPYGPGSATATLQYAYDELGNMTCRGASDRSNCVATGGTSLVFPAPGPGVARPHAPTSVDGSAASYSDFGELTALEGREYHYDERGRLREVLDQGESVARYVYDAAGNRRRTIRYTDSLAEPDYYASDDFEWDSSSGIARTHISLAGTLIATQSEPFTPPQSAEALPISDVPRSWVLFAAAIPAAIAALLLAWQLLAFRRRYRLPVWEPALAGTLAVLLYLSMVTPALSHIRDGDLNRDQRLDAADALLISRILSGDMMPTPTQEAVGDVAPLNGPPDGALLAPDALLIMRAVNDEDVDGDGLATSDELGHGASPFLIDTDGDGVSDYDEIMVLGTDPASADTDGDGILDGVDASPLEGVLYRHTDHLGSVAVQMDSLGYVVSRLTFKPFGQAVDDLAAVNGLEFGFTGQRFDAATRIYDYRARWYDPRLGRFLSPDPVVPAHDLPQSLNRYSYVLNNPLALVDPSGNTPNDFDTHDFDYSFDRFEFSARDSISSFVDSHFGAVDTYDQYEVYEFDYEFGSFDLGDRSFFGFGPGLDPYDVVDFGFGMLGALGQKADVLNSSPLGRQLLLVAPYLRFGGASRLTGATRGSSTSLFRAVGPDELSDIQNLGRFRNPAGSEVKFFSTAEEGASSFARQSSRAFGDGPFTIIETRIPTRAITPEMRAVVDRGIDTVVVPTRSLDILSTPRILPSAARPK